MRKNCIVCGMPLFDTPIYICRNMPANSQYLPTKENLDEDKAVDYNLCQCSGCGLVQFDCEPVPYYLDSTRAGERSDVLVKMRREQYKHLIETYHLQGKKILEIGAGKGGFLKTLMEMEEYSIQGYGIENNSDFARIAHEVENVNVMVGNPEKIDNNLENGPFDAFVSFAYPARLINPNGMLQGIRNNLVDGGIGLLQVASLEHLMKPGGFFDLTVDHIAYYNEDTFRFLCQRNGFDILEHGEIGELYIYAIVQKRKVHDLNDCWKDVEPIAKNVKEYVNEAIENGEKIAVWCAGHFAFTVLSIAGIGDRISYIIDNAPFKQNHFAPASHVPIFGADHFQKEPVDKIIILGPMYVDEIIREIREKCSPEIEITILGKQGIKDVYRDYIDGKGCL